MPENGLPVKVTKQVPPLTFPIEVIQVPVCRVIEEDPEQTILTAATVKTPLEGLTTEFAIRGAGKDLLTSLIVQSTVLPYPELGVAIVIAPELALL